MLQQSGPANTPCSGWRLRIHVQSPRGRRLDIPDRQNQILPLLTSAASLRRIAPRARNRNFAARDEEAKSDFLARQRPVAASHASQGARKCGLFSQSLRDREITGMRGGPGRTRTCNQTVMSGGTKAAAVDFPSLLQESGRVHFVSYGSFLVRNWCGSFRNLTWIWRICPQDGPKRKPIQIVPAADGKRTRRSVILTGIQSSATPVAQVSVPWHCRRA